MVLSREELAQMGPRKYIFERGRNCGITNGLARGFIHHDCDQFIQRDGSSFNHYLPDQTI